MKNLVKALAIVALASFSGLSVAATKVEDKVVLLSTSGMAIDHYVAVMTAGATHAVEDLFSPTYSQKINANTVVNNSREDVISYLKKQKGEHLNCETSTQLIEESSDYAVAKVIQKFENFTKTDYITLEKEGSTWKISKSVSTYK